MAVVVYLRLRELPFLSTLDAWAPCATLAWVFLALGHFAEGSDPGLPSTLPWAVAVIQGSPRHHPVTLYAALAAAIITIILLRGLHSSSHAGNTVALALALCGIAQFFISFLREPEFLDNAPGTLLDPIQWVALGMIVTSALLWQQPRRQAADAI
jgi:phosphatidylglycerol:prolipoprotein diacylglycerol transferase